jgi:hypothetical protein
VVFVQKKKELKIKRLTYKKKAEDLWAELPNSLSKEIYKLWKKRFPKVELTTKQDWLNIVKAAECLEDFSEKYKDHFYPGVPVNLAVSAFDALEHSVPGHKRVHTGYLVTDFFYESTLKNYLIEVCAMGEQRRYPSMSESEEKSRQERMKANNGQRTLYDENGDPIPEESIISRR